MLSNETYISLCGEKMGVRMFCASLREVFFGEFSHKNSKIAIKQAMCTNCGEKNTWGVCVV